MAVPERRRDQGARRLVLGFDGGCATCTDLAKRIEERVGDKLEVRSLHHPQVEHWRGQALGEGAPWAPTFFEVGGARGVKAWTGPYMAIRLARTLGPVFTWRLMRILGEVGVPKVATVGSPIAGGGDVGMSRGQFLKGLGGAAFALGLASSTSSPAAATGAELDYDGLTEIFSAIEDIPESVIERGDKAVKEWLERRIQSAADLHTRGFWGCVWAVAKFAALNAIAVSKILKIRKAIKALGGARNFVAVFQYAYRAALKKGYSKWGAVWFAAKHVARVSGVEVAAAIASFFEIDAVWNNCT